MNFAAIYGWNPILPSLEEILSSPLLCFVGEAAPAGGTDGGGASGGTPAPSGGSDGSGDSSGAGDTGTGGDTSPIDAFSGMDDFDSIDLGDVAGTEEPPATPPTETPPAAPVKTPPAAAQPPAATPPVATPPAAATVPTTPSAPRSAREELSDAVDGFKNNFNELVGWAQGELFKLSPEETEELDTNAVGAIPKLMARTYTQAVMASANIMRNFAQRMIEEGFAQQSEKTARANEAKSEFYKAFPNLNPKDHDQTVAQYAKTYRQMNPKASRADAIKFVGNAVLAHYGLTAAPPAAASPGGPGRTPPFQPARPGGRAPAAPVADDPYAGLDHDFLDVE